MINLKMILVEGGTFEMGGESDYPDCKPIHPVTLSSFYIGQFIVTQKECEAVMNSNPSQTKGDDLPVTNVSWYDIQEFIQKLNERTGKQYRLPTEAEWEFAARGGVESKGFEYAGSNNVDEVAWYYNNSKVGPRPVGQKKPNELGIYDMSGNVWEWCQDWYDNYSGAPSTNQAWIDTPRAAYRVIRGGSWLNNAQFCSVSVRSNFTPSHRDNALGFRLAMSV